MKQLTLKDLFFFSSKIRQKRKRLIKPISYILYKEIVFENVPLLNKQADDDFFIQKYDYYLRMFKTKNPQPKLNVIGFYSNTRFKKEYYTTRGWNEFEAVEFIKKIQATNSLEKFIQKYGEKGEEKYNEYKSKHSKAYSENYKNKKHKIFWRPSQIEYWVNRGFNKTDAKLKIFEFYSERIKQSYKKRKENGEEFLTVRQLKFWVEKGLSIEDAHKQLQKIQDTRSLDHYIELYGAERGLLKFKETTKKWLNTLNNKSEEEKLDILIRKTTRLKRYSKKSINLFNEVFKELKNNHDIIFNKIYMGEKEFFIYDHENKKINFYDLCIKDIKLIVEYNGIMFHPNKNLLSEKEWNTWYNVYSGKTADEQKIIDNYKQQLALSKKFNYIIIWENESFEQSKNIIINKILEIYEYRNN